VNVRALSAAAFLVALLAVSGATAATQRHVLLTVSITGSGSVRLSDGHRLACSSKCHKTFSVRAREKFGLTAHPGSGWVFSAWSGACRGAKPTCSLRLRHSTGVTATFGPPGSTRANPIPIGHAGVLFSGWLFKVLSVTPNATQQIVAIPGNWPPPAGAQYFMLDVSATYTGGGSSDLALFPGGLNTIGAHNAAYPLHTSGCEYQHLPPPVFPPYGSLYSGQTASGNICFEIASNDADSLLLYSGDYPSETWFALR
jgi:Divergent InlB B-repeat domain